MWWAVERNEKVLWAETAALGELTILTSALTRHNGN